MTVSSADVDLWLGRTLEDRFRIEELIARGGSGTVYRAKHLRIGGDIAVKLVPLATASSDSVARLESEARAATLIGHDNIVGVLDFGRLDDAAFLAMEYLRGETLQERIDRQGPLSLAQACTILIQVAYALDAAHARGVIHHDIKPGNTFLCRERGRRDVAKILDFGLASFHSLNLPEGFESSTELAGTPAYISPESILAPESADQRVDLFALGVTMYQVLAGRQPFRGDNPADVVRRILKDEPTPLSQVVPGLPKARDVDALVAWALQKDPERRLPSADAFRRALIELRKAIAQPARRREELTEPPPKRGLASWVSNGDEVTALELAGVLDADVSLEMIIQRVANPRVALRLAAVSHIDSAGYAEWSRWLARLRSQCTEIELHDCSPTIVRQANIEKSFLQDLPVVSVLAPFYCSRCCGRLLASVTRPEVISGEPLSQTCPGCSGTMKFDEVKETYFRFWSTAG